MAKSTCIFVVAALIVLIQCIYSAKIGPLPGYNGPTINQEAGYITVDEQTGKSYFYWLIYSNSSNPLLDPLVVWYQGGPGCSGLIGLFTEHGPYRPDGKGGMMYNDVSWNNFANVLYIEQPCGVGFSYSNTTSDYTMNDTSVAIDNFIFLDLWLLEHPQFVGSKTWLAGESYAGVYIPSVAALIALSNDSTISNQLVGVSIGNPVITCKSVDYNAVQMDLFYYHALVSQIVFQNWTDNLCNTDSSLTNCYDIFNTALEQIGDIYQQKRFGQMNEPSLDPDDLYQDFCTGNGTLDFAVNLGYPNSCSPVGSEMTAYLNRKDVQDALGVKPVVWNECNGEIHYGIEGNSMIPNYELIFAARPDWTVLVYSGDIDVYTVPFGYTHACLAELNEVPVEPWQPWFVNGATAGYVEVFPHYTYATLKGAGHEAPQYQPLTTYNMFQRLITSGKLNTEKPYLPSKRRMTQARILKKYGIRG